MLFALEIVLEFFPASPFFLLFYCQKLFYFLLFLGWHLDTERTQLVSLLLSLRMGNLCLLSLQLFVVVTHIMDALTQTLQALCYLAHPLLFHTLFCGLLKFALIGRWWRRRFELGLSRRSGFKWIEVISSLLKHPPYLYFLFFWRRRIVMMLMVVFTSRRWSIWQYYRLFKLFSTLFSRRRRGSWMWGWFFFIFWFCLGVLELIAGLWFAWGEGTSLRVWVIEADIESAFALHSIK